MPAPTPPTIPAAFANGAAPEYIEPNIPVTTADPARASLQLGFPPRTMTELIAGGNPPYGQDMNGILFMLSSHTVYQQTGQPYRYAAGLATALSGYAVGTILGMSDGSGLWINRTAGNLTDPDAGGAGWVPVYSYGAAQVSGLVGGTVALTSAQAKKKIILLQGTLGSNLQIVVPAQVQDWLFVNQTSGGFSTTVRTAAQVTGTPVPQGGSSAPTGIYCDGVNAYPTVAPLSVASSQAPTPNTLAERTNAGYLLATYFNSNNPLDNLSASSIFFEYNGDGYHRKISPVNLAAQMSLAWFSGQVSNGQVPFSAVQQYAAALFTSPAFTGVPTAPTAALGTSNAQVATTAFANPFTSSSGFQLPGGIRVQWGNNTVSGVSSLAIGFSPAFSVAYGVLAFPTSLGGTAQSADAAINLTAAGFTLRNNGSVARSFFWVAIGVG